MTFKVAVCASGGGGNFQALIEMSKSTRNFEVAKLIVDRYCGAVEIAKSENVAFEILQDFSSAGYINIFGKSFDLIALAGYMPIIPKNICEMYSRKIINTHPSLLPKHGGMGMYGVKVHESVLRSGDLVTGCTIHYVEAEVDSGEIIQQSTLNIPEGISAWELGNLVFNLEIVLMPTVVNELAIKSLK